MQKSPSESTLELRHLSGMKLNEIADSLQLTLGQVAGSLRRGMDGVFESLPGSIRHELEGSVG